MYLPRNKKILNAELAGNMTSADYKSKIYILLFLREPGVA
jgi:hypothetical protein